MKQRGRREWYWNIGQNASTAKAVAGGAPAKLHHTLCRQVTNGFMVSEQGCYRADGTGSVINVQQWHTLVVEGSQQNGSQHGHWKAGEWATSVIMAANKANGR